MHNSEEMCYRSMRSVGDNKMAMECSEVAGGLLR
jgi:hypothetical protein